VNELNTIPPANCWTTDGTSVDNSPNVFVLSSSAAVMAMTNWKPHRMMKSAPRNPRARSSDRMTSAPSITIPRRP
jgi:hypothetical protein